MVFKSLNGFTPEYLSELFVNRSDTTEYRLRDIASRSSLHRKTTLQIYSCLKHSILENTSLLSTLGINAAASRISYFNNHT